MVRKVLAFAAKQEGYKAFAVRGYDAFGYIITPDDNVLTVNKGDFWGVTFTFDYVPDRRTGSGCSCNDEPMVEVDANTLKTLEQEGLAFAKKLRARFYSGSNEWLNNCYWKERLVEVTA